MVDNYSGKFETTFKKESGLGYLPDTKIKLSNTGYLYNTVAENFLEQKQAFKVWEYLYLQQENVLEFLKLRN